MQVVDRTQSRALRACLLRLLEALLMPTCGRTSDAAHKAARANAMAFVEAGGVPLAVDLVAGERGTLAHGPGHLHAISVF